MKLTDQNKADIIGVAIILIYCYISYAVVMEALTAYTI